MHVHPLRVCVRYLAAQPWCFLLFSVLTFFVHVVSTPWLPTVPTASPSPLPPPPTHTHQHTNANVQALRVVLGGIIRHVSDAGTVGLGLKFLRNIATNKDNEAGLMCALPATEMVLDKQAGTAEVVEQALSFLQHISSTSEHKLTVMRVEPAVAGALERHVDSVRCVAWLWW